MKIISKKFVAILQITECVLFILLLLINAFTRIHIPGYVFILMFLFVMVITVFDPTKMESRVNSNSEDLEV